MAIYADNPLQRLFPDWALDGRATVWLWLILQDMELELNIDDFGAPRMRHKMANHIRDKRLITEIVTRQNYALVPEHDISWIEKAGRQPTWLLREFLKDDRHRHPRCPVHLTPREELIALIDYLPESKSRKQRTLQRLQRAWIQHQVEDKHFNWYTVGGKENEKCKTAWQWYQYNHQRKASHALEFAKKKDVLTFLDGTDFDLDAKLYHLEQIKKKFKAQKTAENRKGKRQTNLSLSSEVRQKLDELAEKQGMKNTELVEWLIKGAYERGMLN